MLVQGWCGDGGGGEAGVWDATDSHVIGEVGVVVDEVGQVDGGLAAEGDEDGVGGFGVVDDVDVPFPVGEVLVYPGCVFPLHARDHECLADICLV